MYAKCNEDSYLHAWNCKSLTAYNVCNECARDLISFPVDQKYKIINGNYNKIENRPRITIFFRHSAYPIYILYLAPIFTGK